MKNTKIFALVATVALLVIGAAFTSFAAQYNWYQQDDEWRCKDKNGDDYYDAWAKSGADWYWLNDEGYMAREALVDDDTKYVDADGKMVKNAWKKVADDEGNESWYYFQAGGKKMVGKDTGAKPVTVGDKKYIFNTDGKMLSGWVLADYADAADDDYAWTEGTYYCGDEDDGAVTYGWRQIECYNEAEDFVDNNYWFYFQTNGKKFAATDDASGNAILAEKTINGKKYAFDVNGVMKAEWEPVVNTASTASASASSYAWFHTVEDGSKLANGWFRVVPSDKFDAENNEDDTAKWFYAKSGKLAHSEIKTIAGKKYAFNEKGEMLTGLQYAYGTTEEGVDVIGFEAVDETNIAGLDKEDLVGVVFYFSDDEDNDGSMKTGAQTVTIDGDAYNFYFSTKSGTKGYGITGKQGNKYYFNGKKVAADDAVADYLFYPYAEAGDTIYDYVEPLKYKTFGQIIAEAKEAKEVEVKVPADKYALISKTGSVASSGTKKDGNGYKATYKKTAEGKFWYVVEE